MITLYTWPTPNGHKITLALEEMELPYEIVPVDIGRGAQFDPAFLTISPNNRIPALVDHAPADGGPPLSIFESAAILLYLGEKTGRFLPADLRGRSAVQAWLAWQVGGLGPMAGQCHHFRQYAPEPIPYAIERYTREVTRLWGVMDRRLAEHAWLAGDSYTVADMAAWPWVRPWKLQAQDLDAHPHLRRWFDTIAARPATARALSVGADGQRRELDDEARRHLFGNPAPTR